MKVVAKFKVIEISQTEHWEKGKSPLSDIRLHPVYDSDPESENGKFYAATPTGEIRLTTVNKAAADSFEVGKEYFVTFEKAGNE